jgi:hypothetical protein
MPSQINEPSDQWDLEHYLTQFRFVIVTMDGGGI